jgi:hypothetical protein
VRRWASDAVDAALHGLALQRSVGKRAGSRMLFGRRLGLNDPEDEIAAQVAPPTPPEAQGAYRGEQLVAPQPPAAAAADATEELVLANSERLRRRR